MLKRVAVFLVVLLAATGCSDDKDQNGDCTGIQCELLPPTSEANLLHNLEVAYEYQDIDAFADLLADDFRFYSDVDDQLPVFWNRDGEVEQTECLFDSPEYADIRVNLTFFPTPETVTGSPELSLIHVQDTLLEVDVPPSSEEPDGMTLRVDGQIQKFYFRKGRTPDDVSERYYIVEWRDLGFGAGAIQNAGSTPLVENTTWGEIKSSCSTPVSF